MLNKIEEVMLSQTVQDKLNPKSGTTANRPTTTVIGFQYYDTTLGKPIYWNGTVWKDSAGTTV